MYPCEVVLPLVNLRRHFERGYNAMMHFRSFYVQQKISRKEARVIVMFRYDNLYRNKQTKNENEKITRN